MGKGYKCVQNTYHFNFNTHNDVRGSDGVRTEFMFQMPTLPTLPYGESKTAIFTLQSASIGQQDNANNIAGNDGLYVGIEGLGLRPQYFGGGYNAVDTQLLSTNRFWIPNTRGDVINTNDAFVVQTLSLAIGTGSELNTPYQLICSNPSAQQFRVKLFNEAGAVIVATAGNLNALTFNLCFSIELIPPEIDQNL
tara:strand:+ start:841 stop:1422 length:582 start_codon:yes stop_codon:yes gene_type:complete